MTAVLLRRRPDPVPFDADVGALLHKLACAEARSNFWAFRKLTHPDMMTGWWVKEVAAHLMDFYTDYINGLRPRLILTAPPQHGKSYMVSDFLAWVAGRDPDITIVFTSYADSLGVRTNLALQRIMTQPPYDTIFPFTRVMRGVEDTGAWQRNTEIIEFIGQRGSFRNTTVHGQITGHGLDIGVIDDPIKGRKEAHSQLQRDTVWEWLTDDFFSRFSANAGFLLIMTRWHVDDPVTRFVDKFPHTRVLRYPAIADTDEVHRLRGQALFPEHKPLDFLLERKQLMTAAGFASEYQGAPFIAGGSLFPIAKIKLVEQMDRHMIVSSVRYWDKAATEGGGAYTAGVLMHKLSDNTYIVEDIRHGQWSALEREQRIEQTAQADAAIYQGRYEIWVEQEPGSGGKESAELTVRRLAGHRVYADRVTGAQGSKEIRAEPFAAQVQGGNVKVLSADWNLGYFDELEEFPSGKRKDRVDASSGAFNKLALPASTYNIAALA